MKDNNEKNKLNFKLDEPLKHEGEGHTSVKNMSRRELLGQGFILGSGYVMAPTILSSIANQAQAQVQGLNCGGGGVSLNPKIGFLSIDLSGGAAISGGNVMVGGPGGQTDMLTADGYRLLGFAPNTQGQMNNELGILFHSDSSFLRGIMSKTSPECRARINGAVACTRLANDTQNNIQSPLYGISIAGAKGAVAGLIGTNGSDSGGRSMAPPELINLEVKPTRVASSRDLNGTIDTGRMVADLGQADAVGIMRRIASLSDNKRAKLTDEQVKKDLVQCGYEKARGTLEAFAGPDALDVFADTQLVGNGASIWTNDELTSQSKYNRSATYSKAIVNGYVGAGVMEFGGYDYHNGTRSRGEQRDFEAGVAMGGALEYAHRMQKPLILYVFSDGSVRSDGQIDNSAEGRGKGVWRGDRGTTSAALMLVYNPSGRPVMTGVGHQLGNYNPDGQVNSTANLVSNSARNLAYWVILNYMALNGDTAQFASMFPENPFGTTATQLDPYINFQSIA